MNTTLVITLLVLFLVLQCEIIILHNHMKELKSKLHEWYDVFRTECDAHEKRLLEYYENFAKVFYRIDAADKAIADILNWQERNKCKSNEERYLEFRKSNQNKNVKEISNKLSIPYTSARRYEAKYKQNK